MQRQPTGITVGSRVGKYSRRPVQTYKDGEKRVQRILELMAAKVASGKDRSVVLSTGAERDRLFQTVTVPDHLHVLLQKIHFTGDLASPMIFYPQNPALSSVVKELKVLGRDQKEVTYRLFGDKARKGISAAAGRAGHSDLGMHNVHVRQKDVRVSTGLLPAASPCQTLVLQRDYAEALSESIANHGLPQGDSLHSTEFVRVSLPRIASLDPSMVSLLDGLHLGLGHFGTEVAWVEADGFATLTGQMLLDSLEAWMVALVRLIFPKGRRFSLIEGHNTFGLEVVSATWSYAKFGDALTFALYHLETAKRPFLEVSQIETRGARGSHQNTSEVIFAQKEGPVEARHTGFSYIAMVPNTLALLDFLAESGPSVWYDPETMMVCNGTAREKIFFAPTLLSAHLGQTARLAMPTMEHRISQCLFPGSHKQAYALVFCLEVLCQRWIAEGKGAVLGLIPLEIMDALVAWFFWAQRKFYLAAHLAAHARNFELS